MAAQTVRFTLLIAVPYAGIDEWHKTFLPLRQGKPRDLAIDAFGALVDASPGPVIRKMESGFADSTKPRKVNAETLVCCSRGSRNDCLSFVGVGALNRVRVYRCCHVVVGRPVLDG